jgi:hypothetical protein
MYQTTRDTKATKGREVSEVLVLQVCASFTTCLTFLAEKISEKHYYKKNVQFRMWLLEERKKNLNDLDGERQKKYFRKFVHRWNQGRLSSMLSLFLPNSAQRSTMKKEELLSTIFQSKFISKVLTEQRTHQLQMGYSQGPRHDWPCS